LQLLCGFGGPAKEARIAAKKRQTFGKMQRERERAEKRALKQEKKDQKKADAIAMREAEAAGLPWPPPETADDAPAEDGAPPVEDDAPPVEARETG
jgi:hypothetical protein